MIFLSNKNKKLDRNDVLAAIHLIKSDTTISVHGKDELDSVILFTDDGFIKPRTDGQGKYIKSVQENDIVFCIGPAGTGKTYVAVAVAVSYLKSHRVKKIILARPAVEAGESLGFLPGDFKEKVDPYLRPLYDALYDMIPVSRVKKLISELTIEIVPLAYMRGRTLNNAFVILDEAQNTTPVQMKMSLTRLGVNSKAIITGDITQIDLTDKTQSGLVQVQSILKGVDGIDFIYLTEEDVVRHRLVKKIITAYASFNNNENHK
ncbi:PhoH family protein [candidate division KSB1 bacterium]